LQNKIDDIIAAYYFSVLKQIFLRGKKHFGQYDFIFLNLTYNKYKTIQRYHLFLKTTKVTGEMFILTSKSKKGKQEREKKTDRVSKRLGATRFHLIHSQLFPTCPIDR